MFPAPLGSVLGAYLYQTVSLSAVYVLSLASKGIFWFLISSGEAKRMAT